MIHNEIFSVFLLEKKVISPERKLNGLEDKKTQIIIFL